MRPMSKLRPPPSVHEWESATPEQRVAWFDALAEAWIATATRGVEPPFPEEKLAACIDAVREARLAAQREREAARGAEAKGPKKE